MVIEKLVVKTGTACTLKCEKCGEFNPYLAKKGKSYMLTAEVLSKDIYRIAKAVKEIETVHIAGGEALLHNDLFLLLSYIYLIPNIRKIEVVTNGTIIPNEMTINLLKELKKKVLILISDYSSAGVDNHQILEALERSGVSYSIMRDMRWQDRSDVSDKKLSEEELQYITQNCASYRQRPYFTLSNGIISAHCPTAGSLLYYLDLHDECKGNYINIREIPDEDMLDELIRINNADYLRMCNYCVPSWKVMYCQAGKQLEK